MNKFYFLNLTLTLFQPQPTNPPSLHSGSNHNCLATHNTLRCWGDNLQGQLDTPKAVQTTGTPSSPTAGSSHSFISHLTNQSRPSSPYSSQSQSQSQSQTTSTSSFRSSSNSSNSRTTSQSQTPQSLLQSVSLGDSHTCAITTAGLSMCWGLNNQGQCDVQGSDRDYKIVAGGQQTCILKERGDLGQGQGGRDGNSNDKDIDSDGEYEFVDNEEGQSRDHELGRDESPNEQEFVQFDDFINLESGTDFESQIVCQGNNNHGQISILQTNIEIDTYHDVKFIDQDSTVKNEIYPIKESTIYHEPTPNPPSPNPPSPPPSISAVSLGAFHTCLTTSMKSLTCFGLNTSGQCDPFQSTEVESVQSGSAHSCALQSGGVLQCWGSNARGQVELPGVVNGVGNGQSRGFVWIGVGGDHSCVVLHLGEFIRNIDGNSQNVNKSSNHQHQTNQATTLNTQIDKLNPNYHSHQHPFSKPVQLLCWGDDTHKQLNPPHTESSIAQVSCGAKHSCLLDQQGSIRCWGDNFQDQCHVGEEYEGDQGGGKRDNGDNLDGIYDKLKDNIDYIKENIRNDLSKQFQSLNRKINNYNEHYKRFDKDFIDDFEILD